MAHVKTPFSLPRTKLETATARLMITNKLTSFKEPPNYFQIFKTTRHFRNRACFTTSCNLKTYKTVTSVNFTQQLPLPLTSWSNLRKKHFHYLGILDHNCIQPSSPNFPIASELYPTTPLIYRLLCEHYLVHCFRYLSQPCGAWKKQIIAL